MIGVSLCRNITGPSTKNKSMVCSAINGLPALYLLTPMFQRPIWKREQVYRSGTTRDKHHFLDMTKFLHSRTHSSCGCLHQTYIRPKQTILWMGAKEAIDS